MDLMVSDDLCSELAANSDHISVRVELLEKLQTCSGSVGANVLKQKAAV